MYMFFGVWMDVGVILCLIFCDNRLWAASLNERLLLW